jgi:uncharacterized RDD family membrane protein YckC
MSTDHRTSILTPEQIEITYVIAGIGSRFVALAIDTIYQVLIAAVAFYAIVGLRLFEGVLPDLSWVQAGLLVLVGFLLFYGYYVFFETVWNGQTPGKRVVGLRVVRIDGRPIGFSQAAIRNVVRVLDSLPVYYAIGVLVMFLNKSQRRLGDLAAGTVVVHEGPAARLQVLPAFEARVAIDPLLVRRVRPEEYDLIRRFLLRRAELLPAARAARAAQIAASLRYRDEMPDADPEALLESLAAAYRAIESGRTPPAGPAR